MSGAPFTVAANTGVAGTRILGLGHYRPGNVITNHDLIARGVDSDDEWIKTRVGIAERRWADADETVVDMAEQAGSKALAASGVSTADVDLVLVATCTMPTPVPAAAPQLAARLGIDSPGAYDVNSGCSGFMYALSAASAAVLTGQARHVLVVAAERFSGWLDMTDRGTCIILGDAAGAAVVGPADAPTLGPVVWGSDGALFDTVAIDEQSHTFRQEGQTVYRWATGQMAPVALEACRRAGVELADIAAFVPHQANLRIIEALARRIGLPNAVIARDIVTSGNTSAATIPLALSRMVEAGEIPSAAPVLLLGFGSGLAYAGPVVLSP
jgi:3-oxoacyl-[acyl-carrier-protein] synthase III